MRTCAARGCERLVRPDRLMCYPHWRRVPTPLQHAVWATYRPGQETRGDQTPEYLAAMRDAMRAVAEGERGQ